MNKKYIKIIVAIHEDNSHLLRNALLVFALNTFYRSHRMNFSQYCPHRKRRSGCYPCQKLAPQFQIVIDCHKQKKRKDSFLGQRTL